MRGALYMTLAMAGFGFNDAAMKTALAELPLYPAMLIRGIFTVVALFLLAWASGALRWRPQRRDAGLITLRSIAEVASTVTFLTALANMPIASTTAILQSAPLAVTLAAALFLAEPVGWKRGVALAIGFSGVLLIIRPGADSFNPYAIFAVGTVIAIVFRDLLTRQLSRGAPSLLVALVTSVVITLTGAIGSLTAPFPQVGPATLIPLAISAACLIVGYTFSVSSMRVGDIAFVAPFRYSILLWALILGVVVFGDIPDTLTLIGAALIVATGLFTFWREQRVARRAVAMRQPLR
nr:DMT family transporter [Halovulum dunhuangense]